MSSSELASVASLEADWDTFCAIESEIGQFESQGIEARWRCGCMLLRYEKQPGSKSSPLAAAIRQLSGEFSVSEAELKNRRQLAEEYPGEENLATAVARFGSWTELRDSLGGRGGRRKVPSPPPPLPEGCFRAIVLDPPWPVEKIVREVRPNQTAELDYPVMQLGEIAALPIPELADPSGCHIYLWVTQRFLRDGFDLFDGWDVNYQCLLTWVKNVGMTPFSWMYDTEHVLFGRIGDLSLQKNGERLSFSAPTTGHSTKPDIFYERVATVSPGPRLEMFARRSRDGFTVWGNEVETA